MTRTWMQFGEQAFGIIEHGRIVAVLYRTQGGVGEDEDGGSAVLPTGYFLAESGHPGQHVHVAEGDLPWEEVRDLAAKQFMRESRGGGSYPTPRYSFLAFQFLRVIDAGGAVPMDEISGWISDRSVFDRMIERFTGEPFEFDVSGYDGMERELIMHTFERLLDAGAAGACGVRQEGLAMCAAFCVEVLQHPQSYEESN